MNQLTQEDYRPKIKTGRQSDLAHDHKPPPCWGKRPPGRSAGCIHPKGPTEPVPRFSQVSGQHRTEALEGDTPGLEVEGWCRIQVLQPHKPLLLHPESPQLWSKVTFQLRNGLKDCTPHRDSGGGPPTPPSLFAGNFR